MSETNKNFYYLEPGFSLPDSFMVYIISILSIVWCVRVFTVNTKMGFTNIKPDVDSDSYTDIMYKNIEKYKGPLSLFEKYKRSLSLFITKITSINNTNTDKSITLRYNMD